MIAEAATWRQHREHQQRRRCATRYRTIETLWEDVARRQRESLNALQQADAPASAPARATPPEPEPPAEAGSPRQFVYPNVVAGEAPVVRKPGPTFADVARTYNQPYRRLYGAEMTVQQDKVLREMLACYTPLLGTHEWTCGDCGTVTELPNGCNNRHCCTCGSTKRWRWAEGVCSQILPIEYAHVILTLPKPLTQLAMINQSQLYSMVLREGAYAMTGCARELFSVELALLALLHSWGQLMLPHVHSHILLPLGGLRRNSLEWIDLSQKQLKEELLKKVEREFPKRFCKALRKAYGKGELQFQGDGELTHLEDADEFERWLKPMEDMSWIVRCGDSWDRTKMDLGPEGTMKVVNYLANYVGRVALSDARILDIQGERVLFRYKDYRDHNQQKAEWIDGVELIHRFLQHLLPRRFRHIRRYGWMGARINPEKREFIVQYHASKEPEPTEDGEQNEEPDQEQECDETGEGERTCACRFCRGEMRVTGSTERPRVSELMEMPLARFRRAQVGMRVTLGDKLPEILDQRDQRKDDSSAPLMTRHTAEIYKQLIALATSSSL